MVKGKGHIKYITECKDAIYEVEKYDVVLIATSIYCLFNGGFGMKMRNKYPIIEEVNNEQPYADTRRLGKRLTMDLNDGPTISLLYCCKFPRLNSEYIDYDAFENCLKTANVEFKGKNVMCDMLGMTKFNGNGDAEKCKEIIERCLTNVNLTIYDYTQYSKKEEKTRAISFIKQLRVNDPKRYENLDLAVDELLAKLYVIPQDSVRLGKRRRGMVNVDKIRFDREEFNRRVEEMRTERKARLLERTYEKMREEVRKKEERKAKREAKKLEQKIREELEN